MPRRNWIFFDSERLIEEPELLLNEIRRFLVLTTPLNQTYEIFKETGKPILGDPSQTIMKGKIVKTGHRHLQEIDLNNSEFLRAKQKFRDIKIAFESLISTDGSTKNNLS